MSTVRFPILLCGMLCAALTGLASVSHAQVADRAAEQFMVRSWQIEDGLPQNTVSGIAQTHDGYLWFATEEGLARFNGERFRVFDSANESAFEEIQSIRTLVVDGADNLWIGTDGAGLIKRAEGRFEVLDDELRATGAQVVALHVDGDNRVWASAATSGLWVYDGVSGARKVGLPDSAIVFAAVSDASGRVYAGTNVGVFAVDVVTGGFSIEPTAMRDEVKSLQIDSSNRLWASGRSGTFRIDETGEPVRQTSRIALSIRQDLDGRMWYGLDGAGLLVESADGEQRFTKDSGLTHNRVVSLFEDAEGSMWVGTEGGGVLQFSRGRFATYGEPEGLASDQILAVLAASDGTVWAGTEGHGLASISEDGIGSISSTDGLKDDIVTSLAEAPDGTIWVGTFFGGLSAVRNHKVVEHFDGDDGLPDGAVAALHPGRDGSLWVGTDGGVSRYDGHGFTTYDVNNGLGSNYITAIHEGRDGTLWIGTYDAGLYTLRDGTISGVDGVPESTILSIVEDDQELVWVSTIHDGVFVLDRGVRHQLSRLNGLPSNTIYSVVFDNADHVWMSSNKGLFAVSRTGALEDENLRVLKFGTLDGLRSVEFNGGVQPSASRDPDGGLWFPSIKGLVSTSADMANDIDVAPPLAIEGIRVNGESRQLDPASRGYLDLKPGEYKLEVDVAAITFRGHERVVIEYRLEGQDTQWSSIRSGQTITYTNLSPRDYRLQIRTVVGGMEGDVVGTPLELGVRLRPFFYEQPAFWALILLMTIAGSVAVHRLRVRRVRVVERARQRHLEQQVAERTQELRELNEQLEEKVEQQVTSFMKERRHYENSLLEARDRAEQSEALKDTLLTNMTHEFRTPISTIVGFSDILVLEADEQGREFLGYIRQSADRLLNTLTAIIDLSELESRAVSPRMTATSVTPIVADVVASFEDQVSPDAPLTFVVDSDTEMVAWVDPSLLRKIATNLIHNAIKFTDSGRIDVRLTYNESSVVLTVTDTGVGMHDDFMSSMFEAFTQESTGASREFEGCGLGLTVVKRLVEMSEGTVDVTSQKGKGSTFSISLPSHNPALNPDRSPSPGAGGQSDVLAQSRERSTARRHSSTSRDLSDFG